MDKAATTSSQTMPRASAGLMPARDAITLILLAVLVLVLSLTVFSRESLRLDEAQSLWQTSHSPRAMLEIIAKDVHVPLYHFMLHYWQVFFGNSVASGRSLSLIFFIASIPAMYMLGTYVYNRRVGLVAAVLMSISPFLNWYGNEIRMYSLFTLLTILNIYFYLKIFKGPANGSPGRGWLGYTITSILGIFTHYYFILNLVTQAVFYLIYNKQFPRKSLQMFLSIAILLLVIYAPWLYYVISLGAAANTQPMLTRPTTIDVFNTFSQFIFGFQDDHLNTILVSLWPILVLLIFLSLRQSQRIKPPTAYLFFSLFLPIFLAFVISNTVKPIYVTRYLILSLPSLYLLISWIIFVYPPRLSRAIRLILVAGMAITLAVEIANADTPVKENYRQASEYLSRYATSQDIIAVSAPFTIYPIEYYYDGPAEVETLPLWDRTKYGSIPAFDEKTLPQEVDAIKDDHQVLWLLLSYDQGYEEKIRLYFDNHFEKLNTVNFSPDLNLYAYRLRYDRKFTVDFPATSTPASRSFRLDINNLNDPLQNVGQRLQKL